MRGNDEWLANAYGGGVHGIYIKIYRGVDVLFRKSSGTTGWCRSHPKYISFFRIIRITKKRIVYLVCTKVLILITPSKTIGINMYWYLLTDINDFSFLICLPTYLYSHPRHFFLAKSVLGAKPEQLAT